MSFFYNMSNKLHKVQGEIYGCKYKTLILKQLSFLECYCCHKL